MQREWRAPVVDRRRTPSMARALGTQPPSRMEWRRDPAGLLRRTGGTHAASRKNGSRPLFHTPLEAARGPTLFSGAGAILWRIAFADARRPVLLHFAQSAAARVAQSMGQAAGIAGQKTEPSPPDPPAQQRVGRRRGLERTLRRAHGGASVYLRVERRHRSAAVTRPERTR